MTERHEPTAEEVLGFLRQHARQPSGDPFRLTPEQEEFVRHVYDGPYRFRRRTTPGPGDRVYVAGFDGSRSDDDLHIGFIGKPVQWTPPAEPSGRLVPATRVDEPDGPVWDIATLPPPR